MQTVGIVLISIGIWVMYCGYYGISAVDTAKLIVTDPSNARTIIAAQRAKAVAKLGAIGIVTKLFQPGQTPYTHFKITDDHAGHLKRGTNSNGVDWGAPVGSPLVALSSGVVTNHPNAGNAGNKVVIKYDSGYRAEYYHLSKFQLESGARVKAANVVGYSGGAKGAAGAGNSSGPHIHLSIFDPSGKAVDPLLAIGKL